MTDRVQDDRFETAFDTYTRVGQIRVGGSGTVVHVKDEEGNAYALKYLSPENVRMSRR